VNADVGACPAPRRRRDGDWRRVANRRRHLIARQVGRRDPEQDRLLRDIAKSAPPRCAAPGTGAFLDVDLRALRHALHHRRLATRSGAHRNRRSRHSQFRACRSHKGDEHAQPKTKTPGHLPIPSFAAKDMVSNKIAKLAPPGHGGAALWRKYAREAVGGVTRFSLRATSARSGRKPVRCENCRWPSSRQAATPHQA
jgi:hypothetical protein